MAINLDILREKNKNKVVYIVGSISLDIDSYMEKFTEAEESLRWIGFEMVINPTCLPDNLPYMSYAPISIAFVQACDVVYATKGWEKSIGAQAEVAYAKMAGKEIIYQEETK